MAGFSFNDIDLPVLEPSSFSLGDGFAASSRFDPGYTSPLPAMPAAQERGFWGNLWDGAKSFGGGAKDVLLGAGSLARAALPIAGIGTSVMGALAARDAAKSLERQSKVKEEAQRLQMQGAEKAQALAPKIEPVIEDIREIAPQIMDVGPRQAAVAERLQADVASPLTTFGRTALEGASAGTIAAAEQTEIDNWARGQKAILNDYFARAGLGDSQMLRDALGDVDREAVAMKAARLDAAKKLGLTALQAGGGAIGAQSDVLSGEATTYGKAGNLLTQAGNLYGVEGNILTGSGSAAAGASAAADSEERMLAELIAAAQRQIAALSAQN